MQRARLLSAVAAAASACASAVVYRGTTVQVSVAPRECDVFAYGAVGDGRADDTAAVQAAISACATSPGGGTAVLPGNGTFLSFGLALPPATADFALRVDGVLRFSNDTAAPAWKGVGACLTLRGSRLALVGSGTVDGNGAAWWPCAKAGCPRPGLVLAQSVVELLIRDLLFRDSPNHQLELYAGPFEVVNVTILAPSSTIVNRSSNTDGVDIHGSPAYIHNTTISTGDDHIAFHANDTLVEDCTFGTGHGTSIGSLGAGTYLRNITVRDSTYENPTTGCHVKADTHSSGYLRDVLFQNLTMTGAGMTIEIESNYPTRGGSGVGTLSMTNLTFADIYSDKAAVAGALLCSSNAPCEGITVRNVVHKSAAAGWSCAFAHGVAAGVTPPITCLQP